MFWIGECEQNNNLLDTPKNIGWFEGDSHDGLYGPQGHSRAGHNKQNKSSTKFVKLFSWELDNEPCITRVMYVCMYVCMYACMHACMYACMHACMYVCIYVYMSVFISILYMYIYIYCMYMWIYNPKKLGEPWLNVVEHSIHDRSTRRFFALDFPWRAGCTNILGTRHEVAYPKSPNFFSKTAGFTGRLHQRLAVSLLRMHLAVRTLAAWIS